MWVMLPAALWWSGAVVQLVLLPVVLGDGLLEIALEIQSVHVAQYLTYLAYLPFFHLPFIVSGFHGHHHDRQYVGRWSELCLHSVCAVSSHGPCSSESLSLFGQDNQVVT